MRLVIWICRWASWRWKGWAGRVRLGWLWRGWRVAGWCCVGEWEVWQVRLVNGEAEDVEMEYEVAAVVVGGSVEATRVQLLAVAGSAGWKLHAAGGVSMCSRRNAVLWLWK